MKPFLSHRVLSILLFLCTSTAMAGTGLMELAGTPGAGPVTVFYPTAAADAPLQRGVFDLELAWQAPVARGNGRLIVISHGSGGVPWVHTDLAKVLVQAGYTVAVPEHAGDNARDPSAPGPASWKRRPAEVSQAIDLLARTTPFAQTIAFDKVGVLGGSAGGHTALEMAGGRWSPAKLLEHCEAHIAEDFASCAGFFTRLKGNLWDGLKIRATLAVLRWRFNDPQWFSSHDPRIAAAIASVPYAADFDMESLQRPRIPLGLIIAGQDINQVPEFHVNAVRQACLTCEIVADLPDASHGIMLSPFPPLEALNPTERQLLEDPAGFDRRKLRVVDRKVVLFFNRHLGVPDAYSFTPAQANTP